MIYPVILSGGSGTRLWPMSRTLYPKQLLSLLGGESLLQQTVRRVGDRDRFARPMLVANEEHRFIIAEQLRAIEAAPSALLLEPVGRNTAPAACVAALVLAESDPEALMLLLPSDHMISDVAAFAAAIDLAATVARTGSLVSFGIAPERPETGYGYMRRGEHRWRVRRRLPGRRVCRKARPGASAGLSGFGRIFLERRDLFVSSGALSR